MIIYAAGVHRPVDIKILLKSRVRRDLMMTFFDINPGKPSPFGLKTMKRLFRLRGKK